MRAGYHGLRVWTVLDGPYWESKGRVVGPDRTPEYWQRWDAFCAEVENRNLRLVCSQGDMLRWVRDREGFMRRLAQSSQAFALVDAGNETWQNGEDDPNVLAGLMRHYRTVGGAGLLTLSSPPGEEREELVAWSQPPADLYDVHGYRGGHWYDKVRHIFSLGYEIMPGALGIQSEPTGPGEYVSVTENQHELDAEALSLMACMSVLSNQAWVYMSGEGVSIRAGLVTEPGFAEVPAAVGALPCDLMTWGQLHHSGTRWAGTRVFRCAAPDVRIDGRIAPDGRFVYIAYGPAGTHTLHVERACVVDPWTLDTGGALLVGWERGCIIKGRLLG